MPKFIAAIAEYFYDLLFPIRCLGCGKNLENLPARERWICPECLPKVNLRSVQVCPFCEKESEGGKVHYGCRGKINLDGLWASAYYDNLIEKSVHSFKFEFIRDLSHPLSLIMINSIVEAEEFGDLQDMLMAASAKEEEENIYTDGRRRKKETLLLSVPLHKRRYNWRGFNQSSLLARNIGDRFGLRVREDVLRRIRNTKPQSKTGGKEDRQKNIEGAFRCVKPEDVSEKRVILVDDICTTSATLNECAKELKQAGADSVWGLVVARR